MGLIVDERVDLPSFEDECFFIAPIGDEGTPVRKRSDGVLDFIVGRAAGELGLTAVRAERIGAPGQINLQVIQHVLKARAAVVDLTGLNPNVFYELAVRHTAKLPVVLIAENDCVLPFDIAQMRTIFFDHTDLQSADGCRHQIVSHLREALRSDVAVDSPIATAIDVSVLQGGSVVERNMAELVERVDEMTTSNRELGRRMAELYNLFLSSEFPAARPQVPRAFIEDLRRQVGLLGAVESGGDTSDAALMEATARLEKMVDYLERDSRHYGAVRTARARPRASRDALEAIARVRGPVQEPTSPDEGS